MEHKQAVYLSSISPADTEEEEFIAVPAVEEGLRREVCKLKHYKYISLLHTNEKVSTVIMCYKVVYMLTNDTLCMHVHVQLAYMNYSERDLCVCVCVCV